MEHDDWGPVISFHFREHMTNIEAVAKALSIALIGDDNDWKGHMSHARDFLAAMMASNPPIKMSDTH